MPAPGVYPSFPKTLFLELYQLHQHQLSLLWTLRPLNLGAGALKAATHVIQAAASRKDDCPRSYDTAFTANGTGITVDTANEYMYEHFLTHAVATYVALTL